MFDEDCAYWLCRQPVHIVFTINCREALNSQQRKIVTKVLYLLCFLGLSYPGFRIALWFQLLHYVLIRCFFFKKKKRFKRLTISPKIMPSAAQCSPWSSVKQLSQKNCRRKLGRAPWMLRPNISGDLLNGYSVLRLSQRQCVPNFCKTDIQTHRWGPLGFIGSQCQCPIPIGHCI